MVPPTKILLHLNSKKNLMKLQASFIILMIFQTFTLMSQQNHDVFHVIHSRKSVRQFENKPIPAHLVETILKAAMAAPSARNVQPWQFYVVTNRDVLNQLAEGLPYAKMLAQAPMAIIVAGDTNLGNPNREQGFNWALDCAAATQNLLLAVEALGLGAVWTAAWPYQQRIDAVKAVISMPEHIIPLNVIPVGYPAGNEKPKEKWDPAKIQYIE
jgi:nitroreductase